MTLGPPRMSVFMRRQGPHDYVNWQQHNVCLMHDRAQSSVGTDAVPAAALPSEDGVSWPAAPEASDSPTILATRNEQWPSVSPTHGTSAPAAALAATDGDSNKEAQLQAELAAARQEIAALRAAAETRRSTIGVARRSDLLVLQELETAELRERLGEANGCGGLGRNLSTRYWTIADMQSMQSRYSSRPCCESLSLVCEPRLFQRIRGTVLA